MREIAFLSPVGGWVVGLLFQGGCVREVCPCLKWGWEKEQVELGFLAAALATAEE